jgi:hypothetical protein
MGLNTLIVPVSWELIEPEEGCFVYDSVDTLIVRAREEGMHLVLLWFGLWKNAASTYVPAWMKKDGKTYFMSRKAGGERIESISPLCGEAVSRDSAAFSALLAHLRETDGETGTVVMVQVENEIGLLGSDRDYGEEAEEKFRAAVPAGVAEACGVSGTWAEAFGEEAGENFMAYCFACAVQKIAAAGQKEYALPLYTNVWLRQYPWYPGSYPSGGPVPGVWKIWKNTAPALYTIAPDIYVPYCADVMDEYAVEGNPLFICEIRKDALAASCAMYAFFAKNAIGFSPFGIEELALDPAQIEKPPMEVMRALNIDPSAFETEGSREYLKAVYCFAGEFEPLYLKWRHTGQMQSFMRHGAEDYGCYLRFEDVDAAVSYAPPESCRPAAAGVMIRLAPGKFFVAGMQATVTFRAKQGSEKKPGILKMEEGELRDGEWRPGRRLNGDEQMSLRLSDTLSCRIVELYMY